MILFGFFLSNACVHVPNSVRAHREHVILYCMYSCQVCVPPFAGVAFNRALPSQNATSDVDERNHCCFLSFLLSAHHMVHYVMVAGKQDTILT